MPKDGRRILGGRNPTAQMTAEDGEKMILPRPKKPQYRSLQTANNERRTTILVVGPPDCGAVESPAAPFGVGSFQKSGYIRAKARQLHLRAPFLFPTATANPMSEQLSLRLAIVFIVAALLAGLLAVTGLVGDFAWLMKAASLGLLVLFIVCAAASAWQSHYP